MLTDGNEQNIRETLRYPRRYHETFIIWRLQQIARQQQIHPLMAPAPFRHHISVLFKHNIRIVIEIKYRNSAEFGGRTQCFRNNDWIKQMNKSLDNCMVGSIHVSIQGEGALPVTKEGCISVWRNDPVLRIVTVDCRKTAKVTRNKAYLPAQEFETHVKCTLLTCPARVSSIVT